LGIDALDVFCMSRVDPDIPVEESVGAMARLVERGLTRYISLSEASANSIRRARKCIRFVLCRWNTHLGRAILRAVTFKLAASSTWVLWRIRR